jgi:hypothetical protein
VSVNISFHFGVPYEFTMAMTMQNASGALWEVTMHDPVHKHNISVGRIFFVDVPLGLPTTCRSLGKTLDPPTKGLSSYSFLEYFEAPFDYTTSASWTRMAAFGADGTEYKVKNIVQDCCGHTYAPGSYYDTSRRCLPPECDGLELSFSCGPYVQPSLSAMEANPQCNKTISSKPQRSMKDCWKHGSPRSLDDCFVRSHVSDLPPSDATIVV